MGQDTTIGSGYSLVPPGNAALSLVAEIRKRSDLKNMIFTVLNISPLINLVRYNSMIVMKLG